MMYFAIVKCSPQCFAANIQHTTISETNMRPPQFKSLVTWVSIIKTIQFKNAILDIALWARVIPFMPRKRLLSRFL